MEEKGTIELAENVEDGKPDVELGQVLVDGDGQVQRLPVPSKDPNDPLNYTRWEKVGIIVSCCWFCKSFDTRRGRDLVLMIPSDDVFVACWRPRGVP
jgi:hypothetical protein